MSINAYPNPNCYWKPKMLFLEALGKPTFVPQNTLLFLDGLEPLQLFMRIDQQTYIKFLFNCLSINNSMKFNRNLSKLYIQPGNENQ